MQAQKITIYSTPTCSYCKQAKEFFKERNVEYEDKNVATDVAARQEMVEKSHQMGVPVIVLGDELMVGFNKAALQKWLDIHLK